MAISSPVADMNWIAIFARELFLRAYSGQYSQLIRSKEATRAISYI